MTTLQSIATYKNRKKGTHETEQHREFGFRCGPIWPRETPDENRRDGYREDDLEGPNGVGGGLGVKAEWHGELHGYLRRLSVRAKSCIEVEKDASVCRRYGVEGKRFVQQFAHHKPPTYNNHMGDQEALCFLSRYMPGGAKLQRLVVDRRTPDAETPARGSHMGLLSALLYEMSWRSHLATHGAYSGIFVPLIARRRAPVCGVYDVVGAGM
jgi:hypothetical protein